MGKFSGCVWIGLILLKLKTYCWNHCSKIIFKCVNSTVGPIFNEKVAEKWNLWIREQYTMCCDWLKQIGKVKICGYCSLNSSHKCWLFHNEQCIDALFTDPQISLFSQFFIKNESHGTIHTFKNYFATVFSVFSFQF